MGNVLECLILWHAVLDRNDFAGHIVSVLHHHKSCRTSQPPQHVLRVHKAMERQSMHRPRDLDEIYA